MLKPLSAMTVSPGFKWSINLLCTTISLSEIDPSKTSLHKTMDPFGAIATINLYVVCDLYEGNHVASFMKVTWEKKSVV